MKTDRVVGIKPLGLLERTIIGTIPENLQRKANHARVILRQTGAFDTGLPDKSASIRMKRLTRLERRATRPSLGSRMNPVALAFLTFPGLASGLELPNLAGLHGFPGVAAGLAGGCAGILTTLLGAPMLIHRHRENALDRLTNKIIGDHAVTQTASGSY